jgi:two-component system chemotaxis response regulator CheY
MNKSNSSFDYTDASQPAPAPEKPMRVLIIDDSRATRLVLKNLMQEQGFEVTEAGNGAEALVRLQDVGGAGLILLDWEMPIMNGVQFVRSLRASADFSEIPVLMVTAETASERVAEALAAGVNEYVMKPFTRDIIAEKIELLGLQPNTSYAHHDFAV